MNERIRQLKEQSMEWVPNQVDPDTKIRLLNAEKFAEMIIEECAREVEEFARKWWSIHCHSNKHAETTRKAHDDFCSLQAAIRRRGKPV
jgi:hypothetical protein